jgi:hypothetical protein
LSLESRSAFILLDLTQVYRIETSVAIFIKHKIHELASKPGAVTMALCGVVRNSGVHRDLGRGHVACAWSEDDEPVVNTRKSTVTCFEGLREAIQWCEEHIYRAQLITQTAGFVSPPTRGWDPGNIGQFIRTV